MRRNKRKGGVGRLPLSKTLSIHIMLHVLPARFEILSCFEIFHKKGPLWIKGPHKHRGSCLQLHFWWKFYFLKEGVFKGWIDGTWKLPGYYFRTSHKGKKDSTQTKGVPVCNSTLYENMISSKKEWSRYKVIKRENDRATILEPTVGGGEGVKPPF